MASFLQLAAAPPLQAPGLSRPSTTSSLRCRHDCEEVWLILSGSGTAYIQGKDGKVAEAALAPNSTFTVIPNARHQVRCAAALQRLQTLVLQHCAHVPSGPSGQAGKGALGHHPPTSPVVLAVCSPALLPLRR